MTSATIAALLCRNYINGRWVESRSTQTLERRNPADLNEVLSLVPLSTRAEIGEAVAAAKAVFPAWRDTPAPVRGDSPIAQEEIFGRVLSVIRVPDFEEALRVANSVKYGLCSSIYTNDAAGIFEFIDRIETGMTQVNAPTVVSEAQLPFGGVKATGVGLREIGRVAIDFYTELKAVYIDYTPRKPKS